MNKILKINDKIFYVLLIIILLFAFELYVFEFFDDVREWEWYYGAPGLVQNFVFEREFGILAND